MLPEFGKNITKWGVQMVGMIFQTRSRRDNKQKKGFTIDYIPLVEYNKM